MQWHGFAGNEAFKAQLAAFVDQERFPHAILLEGVRGSGRRTASRHIAMAAVCTGGGERPCGQCAACHKAKSGKHPDIQELGGDGATRSFHIDLVRSVRENAYVLPNEAPRRVFILAEAHNMTDRAQNALLKVLEEPPARALFILTCESRSQLLPTIQSRVVSYTLEAVEPALALPLLKERFPEKTESELSLALSVYGGVIGQAIAGLQEDAFRQIQSAATAIANAIAGPEELTLLKLTGAFIRDKELLDGVLGSLTLLTRDALVRKLHPAGTSLSADAAAAAALSRQLTAQQLSALLTELEQLAAMRRRNMNPTLFATVMCARLRRAAGH